jgi:hypothetical protein
MRRKTGKEEERKKRNGKKGRDGTEGKGMETLTPPSLNCFCRHWSPYL